MYNRVACLQGVSKCFWYYQESKSVTNKLTPTSALNAKYESLDNTYWANNMQYSQQMAIKGEVKVITLQ